MKQIFMRYPGGKDRALTFSYDDAPEADIRFMEILKKNGLKGTFFVNGGRFAKEGTPSRCGKPPHRTMTRSEAIALYRDSGMEVAAHGYTHAFLDQLPGHEIFQEIHADRLALEENFGCLVRGMGCPYGDMNELSMDVVRAYGLAYYRQTGNTEQFDLPNDWLNFRVTCHHKHPELMELAKKFAEKPVRYAPTMFCVGGHTWEFDTKDTWYIMEDFAAYMANRPEIWYATILEICEYTKAFRQLVYSADMRTIYNPTCQTLYFQIGDSKVCGINVHTIGPGETIHRDDD